MDIFSIIKLICGLTFFLFGMKVMSGDLEKLAGGKLESVLKKVTEKPVISILMGMVITVAVQSSSAVAVMLVGLVNSGIMQFSQTTFVLFGANIGTTLTSWILALSGLQGDAVWIKMLKPENFSPIFAFVGVLFAMFSKKEKRKSVGTVLVGFSVLMYGMVFMTQAVSPIAQNENFTNIMVKFSNPFLGLLLGMVVTAVLQSSAASIGILQALTLTGGISFSIAAPIVMGQNIGTCITGLLSAIGTEPKAKRVPAIHTLIKVLGAGVCLALFEAIRLIFRPAIFEAAATPWGVAVIHSLYNIVTTLVLMPFAKPLTKLTEKLVPEQETDKKNARTYAPDELLLQSPSVAVRECEGYTKKMCETAKQMLITSFSQIGYYDKQTAKWIDRQEEKLDAYEDALGTYLIKLSSYAVSESDSRKITRMLHAIGDFERLGDHALNILDSAKELSEKALVFSDDAQEALTVITDALIEIITLTANCYHKNDKQTATRVEPLEQVIDNLTDRARADHIDRLKQGDCSIEQGFVFTDMLTNFERISDHCSNVAATLIEVGHNEFDTHRYLNEIKHGDAGFDAIFNEYQEKYAI